MVASATREYSGFLRMPGEASLYVSAIEPLERPWRSPVVLVPADAEERTWSQRALVNLARRLCAGGHPVLRFDFRGQGESDGAFEDTDLGTRVEDLEAVVDRAASHYGAPPWLVGLRLGASLAIRSAASRPRAVAGVVAVEPLDSGEAFLEELLRKNVANQFVVHKRVVRNGRELRDRIVAGSPANCNGFLVARRYLESLLALDGAADRARCAGLHLFRVQGGPGAAGADVVEVPPFWFEAQTFRSFPASLFDAIVARVAGSPAATEAGDLGLSEAAACGRLPVAIRTGAGDVAATWHPPRGGAPAAFLFLNPGPNDRSGPHGLYLRLASALAERGHGVLRIDALGVGESAGEDSAWQGRPIPGFHRQINLGSMVPSAVAALRWLDGQHRGGRVVFGLCGGAVNAAFTAASEKPGTCDLVLLGTPVLHLGVGAESEWTDETVKEEVRVLGRKLLEPAHLRRLVTFRSDYAHLWRLVRSRVTALLRGARGRPGSRPRAVLHPQTNDRFLDAWERHAARGGRTDFLYSEHDRLYGHFREHFAPLALGTGLPGATRVIVLHGANHNVTERSAEARLVACLEEAAGRWVR